VTTLKLDSAQSLPPPELMSLFNSAYSDYAVPLAFDESAFRRYLADNDIDLEVSRVALASSPVGFALIGRRGDEAWVGGMGTVPGWRRRGIGERTLSAAIEAAAQSGAGVVRLEVLKENQAAISLYERLGFTDTRQLIVCSVRAPGPGPSDGEPMPIDDARRWIAEHRPSREPWQRADPVLDRIQESGRPVAALGIPSARELAAALTYTGGPAGTLVLQMAARDDASAAQALRAATAATGGPIHLLNFPADERVAGGLARLGLRPDRLQREMQLATR
jgi:GNAT superfamily N-acetyltransferase